MQKQWQQYKSVWVDEARGICKLRGKHGRNSVVQVMKPDAKYFVCGARKKEGKVPTVFSRGLTAVINPPREVDGNRTQSASPAL